MQTSPQKLILTGDIGGTNARFALFSGGQYIETSLRTLPVTDNADLADTIAACFSMLDHEPKAVSRIALSVASTTYEDLVELTNNNVSFRVSDLVARFGLQQAKVINDFTAVALGVVSLPEQHVQLLHKGTVSPDAPRAVLGAGTGLGVSGLINAGTHWIPLQGQGGHVSMAAQSSRELAIHNIIADDIGHVSAERYLSGPGIVRVYNAICELEGTEPQFVKASEITAAGMDSSCEICSEVLRLFYKYLGVVAGDLALTLGSLGGIYIAGGIVPQLQQHFIDSDFLYWLHYKGRFSDLVKDMPVWLVTGEEPALFGACQCLNPYYDQLGYTVHAC